MRATRLAEDVLLAARRWGAGSAKAYALRLPLMLPELECFPVTLPAFLSSLLLLEGKWSGIGR